MTIIYTEKGIGLHQAIEAAGYSLWQHDGVWMSTNDTAVQAIIDGYTLAQAIAERQGSVVSHAKSLRDAVVSAYSYGETSSWPLKLAEAQAYTANSAASTPLLSAESTARGITVAALAAKVLNNSNTFAALEAQISGNCGKHTDAIAACTTFAQVQAYDFSAGWPAIPGVAPLTA
jgi:hypothetical protein